MIFIRKAKNLVRSAFALLAGSAMLSLTSCHTVLDDTDCVQSYNLVRFVYDYNIKFADAFGHEVDHVTLFVFDHTTGVLVKRIDAPRTALGTDHSLVLDIEPGTYDLLTWAGDYDKSFDIAQGEVGRSTLADFDCHMRTETEDDGGKGVCEELAPLYHNLQTVELPYASPSNPHTVTVPLVKDTNTFRIVLQHINGEPVDYRDFEVTVTDSNGWMGHDNRLLGDEMLTYRPIYEFSGTVDINTDPVTPSAQPAATAQPATRSAMSAMLVEFTTGRLLESHKPMLTVKNKKADKVVFQIDLNQAALLVKGFHREKMSNQEYLDRQDEYNMTFFLDDGSRWVSTVIIINDWRIIRHEGPLS